jgi:hypothetical protein
LLAVFFSLLPFSFFLQKQLKKEEEPSIIRDGKTLDDF